MQKYTFNTTTSEAAVDASRLRLLEKRLYAANNDMRVVADRFDGLVDRLFGPKPSAGGVSAEKQVSAPYGGALGDLAAAAESLEATAARLGELAETLSGIA